MEVLQVIMAAITVGLLHLIDDSEKKQKCDNGEGHGYRYYYYATNVAYSTTTDGRITATNRG